MKENISILGRFKIEVIEDNEIVNIIEFNNKIVKQGLSMLINGLGLNVLNRIKVGSSSAAVDYLDTDLYSTIAMGNLGTYQALPGLDTYEYGYSNYFGTGEAVGTWREVAATNNGGSIFNRALVIPPFTKLSNQSAFVSVIFKVHRATGND